MVAVTAKNTSFDNSYSCKASLSVQFQNRAHFMDVWCQNVLLARDIKICLGFSTGALKTAAQI